jgi:single-strand DNA-binding protein
MASFNKVILIGNLTRDVELKYLPKGTPVCNVSMAMNRRWKNEVGEEKEDVYFAECKAFGKQAETIAQYVKKGHPLMVEGRLTREEWDDKKTGEKRSTTRIMIETFQFLKGRDEGAAPAPAPRREAAPAAAAPKPDLDEDDVPF